MASQIQMSQQAEKDKDHTKRKRIGTSGPGDKDHEKRKRIGTSGPGENENHVGKRGSQTLTVKPVNGLLSQRASHTTVNTLIFVALCLQEVFKDVQHSCHLNCTHR